MNRSYHLILCRLQELRSFRIFPARRLTELRGLTREMQLEINFHLLEQLKANEAEDWQTSGKVRTAREKRFKKPVDFRR
ncbi:MAG TPA: hypothetical protein VKY85_08205 [Candidatus Angelobacter sp.]|nr:hypothetical protein [Candidatus Angelobacter sp.]